VHEKKLFWGSVIMVIVDVQNTGVPHILYFISNVLCLYTIFILQCVHV